MEHVRRPTEPATKAKRGRPRKTFCLDDGHTPIDQPTFARIKTLQAAGHTSRHVADALHTSAQKLDPGQPPHRGWRKGAAAISILLAAAATAVAALAARKRKAESAAANGEPTEAAADEAQPSPDGDVKDTAQTSG